MPQMASSLLPPAVAVVDDDPGVRSALTFSLETAGLGVAPFADARSMLQSAGEPRWACLVLDYRLPEMSGLDLLRRLRALVVAAPAILITSNPSKQTRAAALAAGVEIVEKPLLDDALVCRISALVRN